MRILVSLNVDFALQVSLRYPQFLVLSMSLPTPPPETIFVDGLPFGAIEAIKAAYGALVQILDPPKDGYNLTMRLDLVQLPQDEGSRVFFSRLSLVFHGLEEMCSSCFLSRLLGNR